jgi:hypothetical protein
VHVSLTEQRKLQGQAVLGSLFILLSPPLLAKLRKHSMGGPFLELEFSGDIGHTHPARLPCE